MVLSTVRAFLLILAEPRGLAEAEACPFSKFYIKYWILYMRQDVLVEYCVLNYNSFPQVSPPKPCIRLSSPPYALHAPPISFFSILSPEQNWVSSTYVVAYFKALFDIVIKEQRTLKSSENIDTARQSVSR
jgi:hypothetical protein